MKTIQLTVPDPMYDFLKSHTLLDDEKKLQLALFLYPYIKNETISFGYAADLIGMNRLDFIELYGSIGIPYFDMTAEELVEEIKTAKLGGEKHE